MKKILYRVKVHFLSIFEFNGKFMMSIKIMIICKCNNIKINMIKIRFLQKSLLVIKILLYKNYMLLY